METFARLARVVLAASDAVSGSQVAKQLQGRCGASETGRSPEFGNEIRGDRTHADNCAKISVSPQYEDDGHSQTAQAKFGPSRPCHKEAG